MTGTRIGTAARADLKFQQLADELRRDILAGTWPVGAKLPTETELMGRTGLSLTTVRRAFDELVHQDLVVRRRGAGTFVAERTARPGRSRHTIGVLIPDTQLYYGRVLQGLEEHLSSVGARLQLATYNYQPEREDAAIDQLIGDGVDGLILVPTLDAGSGAQQRVEHLTELPVPVVFMERSLAFEGPADRTEHVVSDHQAGAYDAVLHLHRLGRQRIGLVWRTQGATGDGVRAGYVAATEQFGLERYEWGLPKTEWTLQAAARTAEEIAERGCDAALVFGDREATLVQSAWRRAGRSVPGDLAMVSYDDELAELAEIPLTAVAPAKHRIGRLAAQAILRRIAEGDSSPLQQVRLRPRLVIRESCGAVSEAQQGER